MTTGATTLPEIRASDPQADVESVVHLVCGCQLDSNANPLRSPLVALCGWSNDSPGPPNLTAEDSRACAMCLHDLSCPVCGGLRYWQGSADGTRAR